MKKIVLISCTSKKLNHASKAKNMYISPLFKKSLSYALSLHPDKIFILSAKYGLLELDDMIEPYNITLNSFNSLEIKKWAKSVLDKLDKLTNFEEDEFIILAGKKYRKFLVPHFKHYKIPMLGLGIGKQLHWLSERIKT